MIDTDRLVEILQEFVEEHEISSEEVIYHSHSVVETAPELIVAMIQLVGFAEVEAEDEIDAYGDDDDFD